MIDFIEGIVAEKANGEIVINAGGVGFLIQCSSNTVSNAPAAGEKWKCHTILNVREDAMDLYGFSSKQERAMFKRLCMVSGVGAKTALGILSAIPIKDLSVAILTGDVTALSRAPGIGKKTAQRIVLELKDKVEQADVSVPGGTVPSAPVGTTAGNAVMEAQAALQSLGYTSAEAARAINLVKDQASETDKLIMLALRQIGSL